jgi:hypothetical protein
MKKYNLRLGLTRERVNKYFDLFFLHPQLNLGSSMLRVPLVRFKICGTFYVVHFNQTFANNSKLVGTGVRRRLTASSRPCSLRGCQMVYIHICKPKISILENFGGPRDGKCWYILCPFGIF